MCHLKTCPRNLIHFLKKFSETLGRFSTFYFFNWNFYFDFYETFIRDFHFLFVCLQLSGDRGGMRWAGKTTKNHWSWILIQFKYFTFQNKPLFARFGEKCICVTYWSTLGTFSISNVITLLPHQLSLHHCPADKYICRIRYVSLVILFCYFCRTPTGMS